MFWSPRKVSISERVDEWASGRVAVGEVTMMRKRVSPHKGKAKDVMVDQI